MITHHILKVVSPLLLITYCKLIRLIVIEICTAGKMDHSGIRLHMTPTLREHDIGAILIGSDVGPFMLIPPHFNALTYRGHCMSQCLQYVSKHI